MRIAILADLHLGYERFSSDSYSQAAEALEKAYQSADAILIAGDLFDYRHPKPEVLAVAINLFRNLSKKEFRAHVEGFEGRGAAYTGVPVFAIAGTHERRSEGAAHAVELLGLAGLLVDISQARAVIAMDDGSERIAVSGVGGIADERFREVLHSLNPKPAEGMFNVFMFHQSVHDLLPFDNDYINIEELPQGFDLYIDGHIHNRVERGCHGKPFLIPGSTVLTQLKDAEQEEKGFFVYDTSQNTFSFEKINSRRLVFADVDVSGKTPKEVRDTIMERVEKTISGREDRPIIKLVLRGLLMDGFKNIDVNLQDIPARYGKNAIIEIDRKGMESITSKASLDGLRNGTLDNVSVNDSGIKILKGKLEAYKYDMSISPSLLFDILSSDEKRENVLKNAIDFIDGSKAKKPEI